MRSARSGRRVLWVAVAITGVLAGVGFAFWTDIAASWHVRRLADSPEYLYALLEAADRNGDRQLSRELDCAELRALHRWARTEAGSRRLARLLLAGMMSAIIEAPMRTDGEPLLPHGERRVAYGLADFGNRQWRVWYRGEDNAGSVLYRDARARGAEDWISDFPSDAPSPYPTRGWLVAVHELLASSQDRLPLELGPSERTGSRVLVVSGDVAAREHGVLRIDGSPPGAAEVICIVDSR